MLEHEHEYLQVLIRQLTDLQSEMLGLESANLHDATRVHPVHQPGASNLLHYLALRSHDIRRLQEELAEWGLSSLGRTEGHVLSAVRAVLTALHRLSGEGLEDDGGQPQHSGATAGGSGCDLGAGRRLLEQSSDALLGPQPEGRRVRIMVTMPTEAATNFELIRGLVASGMNCMRINCAHDGEEAWAGMIANLRQAERETGNLCKVEMDVAGPKLRTGPMTPGAGVAKFHPVRDAYGVVKSPARIWLTPAAHPEPAPENVAAPILVSGAWLARLQIGDCFRLTDTRGAKRMLKICGIAGHSRWAECERTVYLTPGIWMRTVGHDGRLRRTQIGPITGRPQTIHLKRGDQLILTRSLDPGRPAEAGENGQPVRAGHIGVTLPEFFEDVRVGQPIWLDDGKIGGVIRAVEPERATVEITQARETGEKLGAEKGINVPETNLRVDSLTAEDLKALEFIAKNADMVGYSFVRTKADVRALQAHLARLGAEELGIVLKIETQQGFDNLPRLLLAAMRSRAVGVMIARGDLAVECGYQRLAEVQEEILWIAEAAHLPVVWATQVLELLAKNGIPSRSEITDAAMGERAECVMLNKGPYIVQTVQLLDDILRRMEAHQEKKRSMLRKLHVATTFAAV